MRRRTFIAALGGAAAWPLVGRDADAQASELRRVGILLNLAEHDPEAQRDLAEFRQALTRLGWNEGGNLHMDLRWGGGSANAAKAAAAELVRLEPDVVLVSATDPLAALRHETITIPIVFVAVSDPVGQGFVASLAQPGGNITG